VHLTIDGMHSLIVFLIFAGLLLIAIPVNGHTKTKESRVESLEEEEDHMETTTMAEDVDKKKKRRESGFEHEE